MSVKNNGNKEYVQEVIEFNHGLANMHIKYDEKRGVRLVDHEPYMDGFLTVQQEFVIPTIKKNNT